MRKGLANLTLLKSRKSPRCPRRWRQKTERQKRLPAGSCFCLSALVDVYLKRVPAPKASPPDPAAQSLSGGTGGTMTSS